MRALFLLLTGLLVSAPAVAADTWYAVEVIVFISDNSADRNSEIPASETVMPDLSRTESLFPADGAPSLPFQQLPPAQYQLTSVYNKLTRHGDYRAVYHEAWVQPGYPRRRTKPVLVDVPVPAANGGKSGKLKGSISLGKGSYLHMHANLRYSETGTRRAAPPSSQTGDGFDFEKAFADSNNESFDSTPQLNWYALDNSRRVGLNDIVYMDHPVVGVITQVRRYKKP